MKGIPTAVIVLHLAAVAFIALSPFQHKSPPKKIAVRTVAHFTPATPKVKTTPAPVDKQIQTKLNQAITNTPEKKATPKKTAPPQNKTKQNPAQQKKTVEQYKNKQNQELTKKREPNIKKIEKSSKKGGKPQPLSAVPQELLQELEESIAKIEQKRDKLYSKRRLEAPAAIGELRVDQPDRETLTTFESDTNYQQSLIDTLRASLNLPEYGEVTLRITLKKDGTVEKLSVLRSESHKNRKYLEANLPKVHFPPPKGVSNTFILTFCHEI